MIDALAAVGPAASGNDGRDGFVALGLLRSVIGYIVFGAIGGFLGWLTLKALRWAGFFAYLAEKR